VNTVVPPKSAHGSRRVLVSLQAGRGIAAILVVLFHLGLIIADTKYFGIPWVATPFRFGDAGVEFFFVLSGFIIMSAHATDISRPSRLVPYLQRRIIRIYPPYWIVFFLVFILALPFAATRATLPSDPATLAAALLLLPQDAAVVGGTGSPVLIVAWTLRYEILFYVFFGLLILDRRLGLVMALAFGVAFATLRRQPGIEFPLTFLLNPGVWLFGMGIAVASVVGRGHSLPRPLVWLTLASVAFVAIAMNRAYHWVPFGDWNTYGLGIASSIAILAAVNAEHSGADLGGGRILQLIGSASYVLYLIHYPLFSVGCKLAMACGMTRLGIPGAALTYVIMLLAAMAAAVLFHVGIEMPVQRRLGGFMIRNPRSPAAER
jgi:peptidoglycan/LPS O-acetylase OafA/YrhL